MTGIQDLADRYGLWDCGSLPHRDYVKISATYNVEKCKKLAVNKEE